MENHNETIDNQDNRENQEAPPPECEENPQPAPEEQEEPKSELEQLQEKHDALGDQYLRLLAEYDNFRKRSQREKDEIYANATWGVLGKLLPIQDNFERAAQYDCASEEFAKGFGMIEKAFGEALASFGVEAFGEVGEPFDPKMHHAVMHIEDENLGENVVAQVLQKGYKVGERILRHAMVQTAN